jgi:sugar (pentulose or hexulose) kinase
MKKMQKIKILAFLLALAMAGGVGTYYYASAHPEKFGGSVQFVSGTEYMGGEDAQTIVRVANNLGMGLTADWCNVTIYNPDKSTLVTNTLMEEGGADGSWFYNWTAPETYGIYEQYAECKVAGRTIGNSKASHVSEALSLLNETLPTAVVIS